VYHRHERLTSSQDSSTGQYLRGPSAAPESSHRRREGDSDSDAVERPTCRHSGRPPLPLHPASTCTD